MVGRVAGCGGLRPGFAGPWWSCRPTRSTRAGLRRSSWWSSPRTCGSPTRRECAGAPDGSRAATESVANVSQVLTVDKRRPHARAGQLRPATLEQVAAGFASPWIYERPGRGTAPNVAVQQTAGEGSSLRSQSSHPAAAELGVSPTTHGSFPTYPDHAARDSLVFSRRRCWLLESRCSTPHSRSSRQSGTPTSRVRAGAAKRTGARCRTDHARAVRPSSPGGRTTR
jgi:hypothetical protein